MSNKLLVGTWIMLMLTACSAAEPTTAPAATPASTNPAATVPTEDRTVQAQRFVDLLAQGDYTSAAAQFDAQMTQALPIATLQQTWEALTSDAQAGAYQQQLSTSSSEVQGQQVVVVTAQFANATIDIQIAFDAEGKISGLYFRPAAGATPPAYAAPDYVDPATFSEREVSFGAGEWVLSGTLSLPQGNGPFPAVVLVHGSGPNDRDETIGPNKPFRDLAGGLASQGIAVLRYDKRTLTYGSKLAAVESFTLNDETVDDAVEAVAFLRTVDTIDSNRIFVVGHSLGGYALPRIGAADGQIAGLIYLAASARPLEDLLVEQYTYIFNLDGSISADEQQQLDQITAQAARVKAPDLDQARPDELPFNVPAAYWLDLREYQPTELAATLPQPMLFVQGERDYQVTAADLALWQQALGNRADVTFKTYPQLNHLLMAGEGAKATPAEYEQPGHVDGAVIADLRTWIDQH